MSAAKNIHMNSITNILVIANKYAEHAAHFIKMITGSEETPVSFRTFDDKKNRSPQISPRKFDAPLSTVFHELNAINDLGAGVFMVINEGGQTAGVISRVRAVFADTDGAPIEPIVAALKPHMVIRTSDGKGHVYYLVDQNFPLAQFKAVQHAIAKKYRTDPAVCDLSRVMRLPGFNHCKGDPYPVRIILQDDTLPRYSIQQIVEGLGLVLDDTAPKCRPSNPMMNAILASGNEPSLAEVEAMLAYIDPFTGRKQWMDILFALASTYGEAADELGRLWSRGDLWKGGAMAASNYDPIELDKQWQDALTRAAAGTAGITIATLIHRARQGGYQAATKVISKVSRLTLADGGFSLPASPPPPRDYTWEKILVASTYAVLGGPGGVSKTMLALGLAVQVALGHAWAGRKTASGCVALFLGEESKEEIHRRLGAIAKNLSPPERLKIERNIRAFPMAGRDIRLTRLEQNNAKASGFDDEIIALMKEMAATVGKVFLIVIDHARLALGGDPNAADHVTELTRVLTHIAQQTGATVLLLAHSPKSTLNKDDETNAINATDIAGSSAFVDNSRCAMLLTTMDDTVEPT
jgi:hypothetical protein